MKKTRLRVFDAQAATDAQQSVLDEILKGPRGNLDGPFLAWIESPELAQHAQRLGAFCRYRTGLLLRLSELAILVTAARWRSQAEWYIHYPIAIGAGISEAVAKAIQTGVRPDFTAPDEALIYAFATELHDTRRVSDATFERAVESFGYQTVVNLVGLLGYYGMVSMTLNVFDMRARAQNDAHDALPFPDDGS